MVEIGTCHPSAKLLSKTILGFFVLSEKPCCRHAVSAAMPHLARTQSFAVIFRVMEQIRAESLSLQKKALPKSTAGHAANYTLSLWSKLTLFLTYPELEFSTNLAENSMRPIAIGRRNWLRLGSKEAGPRIAAIFSVVELPQARSANQQLPGRCPAWARGPPHQNPRPVHARRLCRQERKITCTKDPQDVNQVLVQIGTVDYREFLGNNLNGI
jgi:hypothetical protein